MQGWLWTAALVSGVGVWGLDRLAVRLIRPPYKPLRNRAWVLPYAVQAVTIPSGDQRLAGWLVRPERDLESPLLILVHGWGSNHGTMARLAGPLVEGGFPVLLFDVRHHGKSRGAPYVTARHFRDDIIAAVEKGQELCPGRPVVLIGHSMGGATSVLAAADGAPVNGLVSIGAPADLWDVWAYHLSRKGLPGRWVIRVFSPFWRARAGVPWPALDPRRRARELSIPFLVIHGEADESVAVSHAEALARAGSVEPHLVPGQGHTELLDHSRTHRLILDFLDAATGSTDPTSSV